jgi:hypothetical protein
VIAQDGRALDTAIPTGRDSAGSLDRVERGRRVAGAQMSPTQNFEDTGFEVVVGDRPCVMRRPAGLARGQRGAGLFDKPECALVIAAGGEGAVRGQPQIERLARRLGVAECREVPRLLFKRCAERREHQVVEPLLPLELYFRMGRQMAPRMPCMRGFHIACRDQSGRVTPEGGDRAWPLTPAPLMLSVVQALQSSVVGSEIPVQGLR